MRLLGVGLTRYTVSIDQSASRQAMLYAVGRPSGYDMYMVIV